MIRYRDRCVSVIKSIFGETRVPPSSVRHDADLPPDYDISLLRLLRHICTNQLHNIHGNSGHYGGCHVFCHAAQVWSQTQMK